MKEVKIKFVPTNEMGVREYFAKCCEEYGYEIMRSQSGFPDWILWDKKKEKRIPVEAEFLSRNFIFHKHNKKLCDLIVCWTHNCIIDIEVLELSTGILYPGNKIKENWEEDIKELEKDVKAMLDMVYNPHIGKYKFTDILTEKLKNQVDLFDEILSYQIEIDKAKIKYFKKYPELEKNVGDKKLYLRFDDRCRKKLIGR